MDELYKTVIKGKFAPIPDFYTSSLQQIIESLIKLSPSKRPTCKIILKDPAVERWSMKLFGNENKNKNATLSDSMRNKTPGHTKLTNELLKTIKNCKNFKSLASKLPKPKYNIK